MKNSSSYVEAESKSFALYTLTDRHLPYFEDGLKPAARRVLWTARNGEKYKSATLGGLCMAIHPHASPEGTINTLAGNYINNIKLLKGDGAFGTILDPTSFGASRYTSVTISKFTKDVMFADIDIIPMQDNYDSSCKEPQYFLPLVAPSCINPQEGVGTAFATNILGRDLENIINNQISYLEGKNFYNPKPCLNSIDQCSIGTEIDKKGVERWIFKGHLDVVDGSNVIVNNLPYGITHSDFIKKLNDLIEKDKIYDYEDESKDYYRIKINFKRGIIKDIGEENLLQYLGLVKGVIENFTIFHGEKNIVKETNYSEYIKQFTEWRLGWFPKRYERLKNIANQDLIKYKDIILAIDKNLGSVARKLQDKNEVREFCRGIGIVNIEYIADLPVYRFTIEEKNKAEEKIKELKVSIKEYESIISSRAKQTEIYISELNEIKSNYKKGKYNS